MMFKTSSQDDVEFLFESPNLMYKFDIVLRGSLERSEEHTSELQSRQYLVCRLLLEKKKQKTEGETRHYVVLRTLLGARRVVYEDTVTQILWQGVVLEQSVQVVAACTHATVSGQSP